MLARSQKGFTLLEVLIAVAITAVLMTTVYGVFTSVSNARARVEESSEKFHQARVFFERISRELRSSHWDADNATTTFKCEIENNQFSEITFSTSAVAAYEGTGDNFLTVQYSLVDDSDNTKTLYRSTPASDDSGNLEESGYPFVQNIQKMQLRFYSNGTWFEKWNSETEKRLPQMVEITLNIQIGKQLLPFSTSVDIPMASNQ